MQLHHNVSEDQAAWLRILESQHYEGRSEQLDIPGDVLDALLKHGFVRRWQDGNVTITLGGIREVARH